MGKQAKITIDSPLVKRLNFTGELPTLKQVQKRLKKLLINKQNDAD